MRLRRHLLCMLFGCRYVHWQYWPPPASPDLIGRRLTFYDEPQWAVLQDWCTRCGNPRPKKREARP